MSPESGNTGRPSRQDTRWLLLALGVGLAALLVAYWLWSPPDEFDPKAWKDTAAPRRLSMAYDFERHWPWRGAGREQLVSWLGPPEAEESGATWYLGAAPADESANESGEAPGVSISFRPGGAGRDALLSIDMGMSMPASMQPFSAIAWAAGDVDERRAMFVSLRKTIKQLGRVDLEVLTGMLGPPAGVWTSFQLSAGKDSMDDLVLVLHVQDGKAIDLNLIGR